MWALLRFCRLILTSNLMHLYAQLLAEFEYDMLFFALRSLITLQYFGLQCHLSSGLVRYGISRSWICHLEFWFRALTILLSSSLISDFSFGIAIIGSSIRRSCKRYPRGFWVPNRDEEAGSSQERRGQIIFGCLYPILLEDYNHAVNTIVQFSSSYISRCTVGLNV
jgi:hypothetical protein